MPFRRLLAAVLALVSLACLSVWIAACRRSVDRLDEVQKMAYGVKPAVVRISAYAKATFRYPAAAIGQVESGLRSEGTAIAARGLPEGEGALDTGAGGSGSGFIIHPDGVIVTSGHVVAPTRDRTALERELLRNGAIEALVKHFPVADLRTVHRSEGLDRYIGIVMAAGRIEDVTVVNEVELSNGEKLPFTIRSFSPALAERGTDLAVIQVRRKNLPVLMLGDSDTVRVGDSVWSVGYPAVASSSDEVIGGWLSRDSDLEPTFNPGTITAIKRDVMNTPVLQSNVAIYRGNSGGPAVNKDGAVVGISSWGHKDAESIKFLVPVNIARGLLAKAGVPLNVEGPFNRDYRAALEAANEGRWIDARTNINLAAAIFQKSPDVIRFQHDVNRAISGLPLWQLHPVTSGVALALAALAAAIPVFVMTRRARLPREFSMTSTSETLVAPAGVAPGQLVLGKFTILNGDRAGEKLGLGGSGIRIGRERTICEIVLENPKVSRLHAEVVSIDGRVMLIDRNSSNGTYVNDQKIDKRYLRDGDIIYFGGRNAIAVAFHA
jgi:S1-C subfamily serine protease